MDDSGIFDNFLDNNSLESNLINIKTEPHSPQQYSLADSYIHLGGHGNQIGNSNNGIMGPTLMTTSQSSSSLLLGNNNNINNNNNKNNNFGLTNHSNGLNNISSGNNGFMPTLPQTTDTSFQHMITQSPFTQQSPLYYYNPSTQSNTLSPNSVNNTPSSPMSIVVGSTDPTSCGPDQVSPMASSSLMTVHHQLINHLQPNTFYNSNQSVSSAISNIRNISLNNNNNNNNNNNANFNNNTTPNQHQQNITRSMYLIPNLDNNNNTTNNSNLNPNNNNISTLHSPVFNDLVQNEENKQHLNQPQSNLLNINSTTPDSILSPLITNTGIPDLNTNTTTTNGSTASTVSPIMIVGELDIIIEQQPPSDVRTRTPNDRRTFNTVIRVVGDLVKNSVGGVLVQLAYANTSTTERPSQFILGGNKIGIISKDGKVAFDSLSMNEASTKHRENEFCLEYVLISEDNRIYTNSNGVPFIKRSRAFYAYSNQKVLSRRRNVTLRTLSSNRGTSLGGDQMHVVGSPFIRCNSLRCIFHTPHGDVPATNIELYSESVLFFTLPPYPIPPNFTAPEGSELPVQVVITNDGRNYSNPLAFTYIYEGNHGNKRLRSRF